MVEWQCPQCLRAIEFPNPQAALLAERAGGCQGCRAGATLAASPALTCLFLDFWNRVGYPESDSWKGSVPEPLLDAYQQSVPVDGGFSRAEISALFALAPERCYGGDHGNAASVG